MLASRSICAATRWVVRSKSCREEPSAEQDPKGLPLETPESSGSISEGLSVVASSLAENSLRNPLVWIDLEMTGLNIDKDVIIEIACILTDGSLEQQVKGPEIAIKHEDSVFEEMHPWCIEQHNKSGLVERCKQSVYRTADAEKVTLKFIQQHVHLGCGIMAGNSIHTDKMFLQKYMPALHNYLSYRLVDVSSIKELCKRWFPSEYRKTPPKKQSHTAMLDIQESIDELKYYRKTIFKSP